MFFERQEALEWFYGPAKPLIIAKDVIWYKKVNVLLLFLFYS